MIGALLDIPQSSKLSKRVKLSRKDKAAIDTTQRVAIAKMQADVKTIQVSVRPVLITRLDARAQEACSARPAHFQIVHADLRPGPRRSVLQGDERIVPRDLDLLGVLEK